MRYAGILQPLLDSVERGAPSAAGRLAGQHVVTGRKDLAVLIAVDADGNIHFLLAPAPENDLRFAGIHLKALTIARREWAVGGKPTAPYLDLTCSGGTQAAYRRPFLSFCEDLLIDLDRPSVTPADAAFRTCGRWKHFWTADDEVSVSIEWIRGLLGELRFLETIIQTAGPQAVFSWAGPDARDHDFQSMSRVAFEVKVSAVVPYTVECNLNQLDAALFEELYLTCYQAVRTGGGESIGEAIARIEQKLESHEVPLDTFYSKLHSAGYRKQRRSDYETFRFAIDGPHFYRVDDDFPKITAATFEPPLDSRVRGVRYVLQLVGLATLDPNSKTIMDAIRHLA